VGPGGADGASARAERLVGLRGSFPILRSKIKGLSILAMATIGGSGGIAVTF
jgi:hypothetical protein